MFEFWEGQFRCHKRLYKEQIKRWDALLSDFSDSFSKILAFIDSFFVASVDKCEDTHPFPRHICRLIEGYNNEFKTQKFYTIQSKNPSSVRWEICVSQLFGNWYKIGRHTFCNARKLTQIACISTWEEKRIILRLCLCSILKTCKLSLLLRLT